MRHILVVGEKTSQVKKFATTLCGSYQSHKQAKYVYTYTGTWKQAPQPTTFTFLPLAGHVSSIDTAKGYGWGECPPIKIVTDSDAIVIKHTRKYVTVLRKQIQGKDELWLGLDPDSEGDNIALEVVNILNNQLKKQNIPVRRIWNSSLTDSEIQRAFINLKPWHDALALGVQGRRLIDAWLGFAGTREITRAARQVAKVKVISVGRVQLPTLRLVVQADLAHETFVIEDRYKLQATFTTDLGEYQGDHQLGNVDRKEKLEPIRQKLTVGTGATITKVNQDTKQISPPQPHNTTAAVSLLTKVMKVKAERALELMVELYNRGLLSYPRTENKKFKDNFPHKEILAKLVKIPDYIPFLTRIKQFHQVRNNGPKKGAEEDHDPIHPTGELDELNRLDKQHRQAFDILTRYYISLFLEDQLLAQLEVVTEVDGELFLTDGRTVVQQGFKEIQWWTTTKTKQLPPLTPATAATLSQLDTIHSKTKPPKRMHDSQLLLDMERANIGTKSSRPDIIKKLEQRNYIRRSGQSLISTDWGRVLIASLAPIWPRIVTPEFTSHVEELMDLVATGKKSFSEMLDQLRKEYIKLHKELFVKVREYQRLLTSLELQDQSHKTTSGQNKQINQILAEILN